jgi:hypothetical protein
MNPNGSYIGTHFATRKPFGFFFDAKPPHYNIVDSQIFAATHHVVHVTNKQTRASQNPPFDKS